MPRRCSTKPPIQPRRRSGGLWTASCAVAEATCGSSGLSNGLRSRRCNMERRHVSRRGFLKSTGGLVVSFSFSAPISQLLAQSPDLPAVEPEATQLDSWLAVAQDGSVTVFTSKVELGTGIETALAQIVADELDVPFPKIQMDWGDTAKSVDQGMTVASRTLERAGPQLRQAAAAARQQLLNLAAARLEVSAEQLTVRDGLVSVDRKSTRLNSSHRCIS